MSDLKLNDKVSLNSGGPAMTVIALNVVPSTMKRVATCTWVEAGKSKTVVFPVETLTKVEEG